MPNGTNLFAPENGSIYATVTVPERNGEKYCAFRSSDGHRVLIYVHVGVFKASGNVSAGQLVALSDNTGISTGSHTHFTYRVDGVERDPMPYLSGQTLGGGAEPMITDADNEYGRWEKLGYQIRGRHLTRAEFRTSGVGQTWLHAMEILSDDPEADATTHAQEVGQVAVKDNWEGQINDLKKAVETLQISFVKQTGEMDSMDKQITAQGQTINDQEATIAKLTKQVASLSNKPVNTPSGGSGGLVEAIFNFISNLLK